MSLKSICKRRHFGTYDPSPLAARCRSIRKISRIITRRKVASRKRALRNVSNRRTTRRKVSNRQSTRRPTKNCVVPRRKCSHRRFATYDFSPLARYCKSARKRCKI